MSDSDLNSRSNSKKKKQLNKQKKSKKSIINKKNIKKNSQIEPDDIYEISNLINRFNLLFLEDKAKLTEKKLIEFTKSYLFYISDDSNDNSLNYKTFIVFILKLCGLEIDIENKDEAKKFLNIQSSSCTDQDIINNLVVNCKLRTMKFKLNSLSFSLNSIADVIYNSFEIIREKEFEKFKNFIIVMLKLSSNRYRKLRYVSCIILSRIFELLYNEISKTKKIVKEKSKLEEKSQNSISKGTLTLLKNKIEILNEIIILLKEKFIIKKISDISKDIRLMIADTLFKVSKKHFVLLFQDYKLIKFFPYFLNDPSSNIKLKYLSLLLEELSELCRDENEEEKNKEDNNDENEENNIFESQKLINKNIKNIDEDEESLKIIVKILSITRDAILSICIKEEKILARTGIKIIELLSYQKILEPKTVHQLLPHLFNPENGIRTLVSRIVVSYILNFENENDDDEKHINSIKDVRYLVEFNYKLSDNENQMVEIIVDDLFNCLNIFKDFQIFFDFIEQELNSSNCQLNFIYNALLIIKYSINKIQMKIDNSMINLININDDFINLFVKKITLFLKKFRVPIFENAIQNNQIKILNVCLELFDNLKIYKANNTFNFSFDSIKEIIKELISSFFINTSTFGEIEINNKDENDMFNMSYNNEIPLFEKLCNNILNAILSILNNKELIEFFEYCQNNLIEEFVYGNNEDKESLKSKFISIIKKEIIQSKIYTKLKIANINLSECIDLLNPNLNINFYILFTQFNYMLIHFPKIFNEEINLTEFTSVIIKILSLNLNLLPSNNKIFFNFKFNKLLLTLIETLHIHLFSKEEEIISLNTSKDKNEENNSLIDYCNLRNDIYNLFFSILQMDYKEENLLYNNNILILKTKTIGIFLDSLIFVCSENIINENLKFKVTPEIENLLTEFISNNFIKFFLDYNKYLKNNNEVENLSNDWTQDNPKKERKSMSYTNNSIFNNECTIKTYCLKIIVEKFSRLLLLNFSIFKYVDLSCLYFETFFLIQHMHSIESISNYTLETIMEKEIQHYINLKNNNPNNKNYITIIIFFLTKITMKIFNEKSLLFTNEQINLLYEDKIEMIGRFLNIYSKILKRLKNKYKEHNVFDKDKLFYSNFILNGMSFALENKIPNKIDSKITDIENVYFLEFIKMFLKINIFFDDEDIKKCIIAYLRMSKNIELTDGINMKHIKYMEKFKNYLLNKGKVVLAYNKEENDNENDNENKENENNDEEQNENEDIEINDNKDSKTKKENKTEDLNELEGDDDLNDNLEKDEKQYEIFKNNEDDEINTSLKKKKEKKQNKKKSKNNKKRNYNEVIKEEDENNEDKINIKKKMKNNELLN